jgi:hypothetical protein
LLDVMEWSSIPIHIVGLGQVASMGLLVLMARAKGHRAVALSSSDNGRRLASQAPRAVRGLFERADDE